MTDWMERARQTLERPSRATAKTAETPVMSVSAGHHTGVSFGDRALIRSLLLRHLGTDDAELDEAMAVALLDPAASLRTLRASLPPSCTHEEFAELWKLEDFRRFVYPQGVIR